MLILLSLMGLLGDDDGGASPDPDITIVRITPPLQGNAVRDPQRDTRANVQQFADTRPNFTFIR